MRHGDGARAQQDGLGKRQHPLRVPSSFLRAPGPTEHMEPLSVSLHQTPGHNVAAAVRRAFAAL